MERKELVEFFPREKTGFLQKLDFYPFSKTDFHPFYNYEILSCIKLVKRNFLIQNEYDKNMCTALM